MRLSLVATTLAVSLAACAGPEDPFAGSSVDVTTDAPADVTPAETVYGDACASTDECTPGWRCVEHEGASVCACDAEDERANDADDDCDEAIDEGFMRIAFWNVRDLSVTSRDPEELSLIADVIEPYHLVALAEVSDELALSELEAILDGREHDWTAYTSPRSGGTGPSGEYYGLLYRSASFAFEETRLLGEIETPAGEPFGREPLLAVGRSSGGFDFALLVVHITWGDGEEERIDEVRAMAEYVEQARRVDPDVILAGDMNLNANDAEGIAWLTHNANLITTTEPTPPTKVDSENTYDHILIDPSATTEYSGAHGVDLFDLFLFPNDAAGASRAVSDHRPVWIAVDVRGADDD